MPLQILRLSSLHHLLEVEVQGLALRRRHAVEADRVLRVETRLRREI
jgi:hypothetical protein